MIIFEGALSVKAVIEGGHRLVSEVMIDQEKDDRNTRYIINLARSKKITVTRVERVAIDEVSSGKTHGGIICFARSRKYQNNITLEKENPFVVVLEGIEDPFNLGYILRTLYASGCDLVVSGTRNLDHCDSVICKSSSGASEMINWCHSDDLAQSVEALKEAGLKVVCAARNEAVDMYDYDYNQPLVMCIGGEMRGLSSSILSLSDQNIVIPYDNDFRNSLNASSAVAVLAYEAYRQKR